MFSGVPGSRLTAHEPLLSFHTACKTQPMLFVLLLGTLCGLVPACLPHLGLTHPHIVSTALPRTLCLPEPPLLLMLSPFPLPVRPPFTSRTYLLLHTPQLEGHAFLPHTPEPPVQAASKLQTLSLKRMNSWRTGFLLLVFA